MSSRITIYHNPQCGTSRNVLALIRNTGVEPEVIEYLQTPPTPATLKALVAQMGVPVREAIRQKEAVYTALCLADPAPGDEALRAATAGPPTLTNRPHLATHFAPAPAPPSEAVLDLLPLPQRGAFAKEDGEQVINERGERVAGR